MLRGRNVTGAKWSWIPAFAGTTGTDRMTIKRPWGRVHILDFPDLCQSGLPSRHAAPGVLPAPGWMAAAISFRLFGDGDSPPFPLSIRSVPAVRLDSPASPVAENCETPLKGGKYSPRRSKNGNSNHNSGSGRPTGKEFP